MVSVAVPDIRHRTSSVALLDLVALSAADDAPEISAPYWVRVVLRLASQYPGFARELATRLPPSASEDDLARRLMAWFPPEARS